MSIWKPDMQGGVMHVVYHAIVKALLFMVVGIVIGLTNERDIRKISGLSKKYPILCICAAIGVLGISGMPPLGIFNSEWMIFAGGFNSGFPVILTILTLIGSIFTVIYALRFFGGIFIGNDQPPLLPEKTNRTLLIPTIAVSVFLIVEGLLPGPLLSWIIKGIELVTKGG